MKFQLIKTIFLATLLSPSFAFTQESDRTATSTFPKPTEVESAYDLRPHLGLITGAVVPEGNYRSTANYGLDFGFQPYIPFTVGLEAKYAKIENKDTDESQDRTLVLARAAYNFGGDTVIIKDSYVALGAGTQIIDGDALLAMAPMVGFDIPLNRDKRFKMFSLGASAKYIVIEGSQPDTLQVNGALKYWF